MAPNYQSLQTLLANQPRSPQYSPEEEVLGPTDYELGEAQAEIGQEGAASGRESYYVPSRESLKTSAMGSLRRMLDMERIEAQNAAYPKQVAGEYGLQTARIKSQGDVAAAQAAAEAAENRIAQQQQFQIAQGERSRQHQAEQGRLNREAISGRQDVTQQGQDRRQQASIRAGQASAYEKGTQQAPIPEAQGFWQSLQRMAGLGRFDPATVNREAAAALRQPAPGGSQAAEAAATWRAEYPNVPAQQLLQMIAENEPDATPEELQELAQYLR